MESYIPRTVTQLIKDTNEQDSKKQDSKNQDPKIEESISLSLEEYIRFKSQRIILFGDAQCGKTIELKHLADTLEDDVDKIVVDFSLSRYSGGKLLENVHTMPKSIAEGAILCFLLDGLDEVKEVWKETILNEILELSEEYKTAIIVLTCRINYESSVSLEGFDTLCLDKLDNRFVKRFIELNSKKPKALYDLMIRHRYSISWTSPFFLKEVVDYFNSYETLPLDKTAIYERFIKKALTIDNDKKVYSNRLTRSIEESSWETFLCKLAFCMMDSQNQEVSYKDVALLFPSVLKEIGDISTFPLFHIDNDGNLSFIHNSFREFFAAKSMVGLDYDEIKQIVCYLNTDILIPSWTQSLMFLMSLLSKRKTKTYDLLLSWLLEKYLDEIIWSGGGFVKEEIKNQIFEDLYMSWADGFSAKPERLMTFAPSITNVERVISGLKEGNVKLCKYLPYANLSYLTFRENAQLCEDILKLARNNPGASDYCLDLRISCLKTHFALDGIMKGCRGEYMCYVALKLISILNVYNDYSDFILANLHVLFRTPLDLSEFFSDFKKEDVVQILQFAIRDRAEEDHYGYKRKVYDSLFKKIATFGENDREEFERLIIQEVLAIPLHWLENNIDRFLALRNFFSTYADSNKLTEECLGKMRPILIKRYQLGDKRYLQEEYNGYSNLLSLIITKAICEKYTGETNETASYDGEIILNCVQGNFFLNSFLLMYDKWPLHSDILQEAIDALLDKKIMVSQVHDILEALKKQGFSSDEDRAARNWMYDYHAHCRRSRSAFHVLIKNRIEWSVFPKKYLDMKSVPEWIEDEVKYTCFVIEYLDKKSQSIRLGGAHLSDEQMEILTALVKRVISNPQKYDSYYTESLINRLLHIIFSFEPPLQDEDYVLLIPYLHKRIDVYPKYGSWEEEEVYLIDYVLDHFINLDFLGFSIEQFLTSKPHSDIALICFKRIIKRKISSLYPYLHVLLKNCNKCRYGYRFYDLYKMLPTHLFSYDCFLNDLNDSEFLIVSESVVEKQSGADLDTIHERLLYISKNSSNDEHILKANSLLVSFGDKDALQYLYDKCPDNDRYSSFPWPSFDYCDISDLELIKQFYIKAVNKRYSSDFHVENDEMDQIQKNLFRLSLDSEEALYSIMDFFNKLAHKYPDRDLSALPHEVYLSFLENKSANRTLSESAKRMEIALSE